MFEPKLLLNLFQNTFEVVRYELIGDGAGPVFFKIEERDGLITVKEDLASGSETEFTVS